MNFFTSMKIVRNTDQKATLATESFLDLQDNRMTWRWMH